MTSRRAALTLVAAVSFACASARPASATAASAEEVYASYTVEDHARDVAALIERLAVGPVDVIAHSYGGNVALMLALSRPELARLLADHLREGGAPSSLP